MELEIDDQGETTASGDPAEAPPELAPIELTSISSRFSALVIDGFLLFAAGYLIDLASGLAATTIWVTLWILIGLLFPAAYFIIPFATGGQTLGMRSKKIRLVGADGSPLNWRRGIARYVGMFLSALPLGLGYWWAIWDDDHQTWHDKLAGTVIAEDIRDQRRPRLSADENSRRQRRWWLAVGVPGLLIGACALSGLASWAYFVLFQDATRLGDWPSEALSPELILPDQLSDIGLGPAAFLDAKSDESPWSELAFQEGVVAEYRAGNTPAAWIAVLDYRTDRAAEDDFFGVASWIKENCGAYMEATLGRQVTYTYRNCTVIAGTQKLFLNGSRIVHILVSDNAPEPPPDFIDQVRDALATHWKSLE